MVVPGLGLYATGLVALGLFPGNSGLVIGGILTGLGHGISYPVILGLATVRAGDGDRGTATATFTALFDLALFGASPLIGASIRWFGYPGAVHGVAVIMLVGAIMFYMTDSGNRRSSAQSVATSELTTAPTPHV